MKSSTNPYNPGAGIPPPELAGRSRLLDRAETVIGRARNGKFAKSLILLGLRGVGKTVLLNRIDQMAEEAGCRTAVFEADRSRTLPEFVAPPLYRILLKLDRRERVSDKVQKAFGLLRSFASVFKVTYGDFEIGVSSGSTTGDLTIDLTDLLVAIGEAARSRKTVAVMLVDEVQYLKKHDLAALIVALHKVSQRQLPFLFFGAGLPQLARLAGEAKSYSERLFEFPEVGRLDDDSARAALVEPARREGVDFDDDALDAILEQTDGYPFFLQVWGYYTWEVAEASPITSKHVEEASSRAIEFLDEGFFRVRIDRLSARQLKYARALAEFNSLPASSAAVAEEMGITIQQAAPIRSELMKKGTIYGPQRGMTAFTVPKFDEFLRRAIPEWPMTR
jgi:hypothetical protein